MRASNLLIILMLGAVALSGCAGDEPAPEESQTEALNELELEATEETGVIRGVVVDAAIRPIAAADVSITCGEYMDGTETTEDGVFGFEGVPPGLCLVRAGKTGFTPASQQTDVIANNPEPPAVKLLLEVDEANRPYYAEMKFEGFIECSFSLVAVGFAACNSVPESNDEFMVEYFPDRVPTAIQSEMVWETTQSASPELMLAYSADLTDATLLDNWAENWGTSPVLVKPNATIIQEVKPGGNVSLMLRVFNQHNEGSSPDEQVEDPVDGGCYDRPALGGCLRGVGATVQQEFTILTHIFYGYEPPAEWRFTSNSNVPGPA